MNGDQNTPPSPQPAPAGDWADAAAKECKSLNRALVHKGGPKPGQYAAIIRKHAPTQQQAEAGGDPVLGSPGVCHKCGKRFPNIDFHEAHCDGLRDFASPHPESPEGELRGLLVACQPILEARIENLREKGFTGGATEELAQRIEVALSALPAKGPGPGRLREALEQIEQMPVAGYSSMDLIVERMKTIAAVALAPPPASQSNPREHKP